MGPEFPALLEPGATFIFHNAAKGHVLFESDDGITIFLEAEAAKRSYRRQYHWHCILKDDCLVFRNAFSGNTLKPAYKFDNPKGQILTAGVDTSTSEDAVFCVLDDLNGEFILYHNLRGDLLPVSMGYDGGFDIFYPILLDEHNKNAVVHWSFEWVQNGIRNGYEVNYGPNDYELRGSSLPVSDPTI